MLKEIKWLMSELDSLQENEIISKETADKITKYYNNELQQKYKNKDSRLFNIISIIGAVLIGLGFILLSAYNWALISPKIKITYALIPLIFTHGLIIWGKVKKFESKIFFEITGTISSFLVGSSMAIISQVYQIQGDIDSFLKAWMILIIPVVYLLRSNMVGFLYFTLTIFWTSYSQINDGSGILFWVFGALIIPYYYFYVLKNDKFSNSSFFFNLAFITWILFSVGIALEKSIPGLWIIIYSLIIVIIFLIGVKTFEQKGPYYTIGKYGVIFMSYLFTFVFFWEEIGLQNIRTSAKFNNPGVISDYVLLGLLIAFYIYYCLKNLKLIKRQSNILTLLPILSIFSFFLYSYNAKTILFIVLLFNLFTLGAGIFLIYIGVKERALLDINSGMIVVGLLIATRFFDIQLGFTERAISFIILGIIFISINFFIKKRVKLLNRRKK